MADVNEGAISEVLAELAEAEAAEAEAAGAEADAISAADPADPDSAAEQEGEE